MPRELERDILAKPPAQRLPWENEALDKVEEWRQAVSAVRAQVQAELNDHLKGSFSVDCEAPLNRSTKQATPVCIDKLSPFAGLFEGMHLGFCFYGPIYEVMIKKRSENKHVYERSPEKEFL